ncbi:MAG: dipeptide/oligopeptide/nickel ABC transporter ATP-binding protein, partial [Lachnospiraceae bacterium]|nr:dipeptide/oligopeptide/nickel ABC transporter ATP-binding protein [Lachnospiraceae bacterium]
MMSEPILTVSHMNAYYRDSASLFRKADSRKQVLKDISFSIGRGEIVGLVGESGCGKSTLGKAVLHMVKDVEGEIVHFSERPQMVFQDPYSSLNPTKTVGWILREPLKMQGKLSEQAQREKVSDMLRKVGLDESFAKRYPRELSGGQRQRVCIATALMLEPKLMIADEPVSALDVTIQAQIIRLLLSLNKELEVAILLISH